MQYRLHELRISASVRTLFAMVVNFWIFLQHSDVFTDQVGYLERLQKQEQKTLANYIFLLHVKYFFINCPKKE